MNTRLQVEHPVTELVTGIDLVREQIRIAAGAAAGLHPGATSRFSGHAIECRINAEDPRDLLPIARPGRRLPCRRAARACGSIRRLYAGYTVPPYYDSLIAKLIVHDVDRGRPDRGCAAALEEFVIDGIDTTHPAAPAIFAADDVRDGEFDTSWLGRFLAGLERLTLGRRAADAAGLDAGAAAQRLCQSASSRWPSDRDDPEIHWIEPAAARRSCRSTASTCRAACASTIRRRPLRDPRRHRLRRGHPACAEPTPGRPATWLNDS